MIAKRYIFFLLLVLIGGAVALGVIAVRSVDSPDRQAPGASPRPANLKPSQTTLAHLYFLDKEGQFLIAEERILKHPENPAYFARGIVEALIRGPQKGLIRTIPPDTGVRATYVDREGICYVDLTASITDRHPGGIKSELFSVYSIVNSVVLNVPEVEAVKILINGDESATLAGHIDLQVPVKANMLLIR